MTPTTTMRLNPAQLQRLDRVIQQTHPGLPRSALVRMLIDDYLAKNDPELRNAA